MSSYSTVPTKEKFELDTTTIVKPKGLGVRHVQALLLFFSVSVGYSMRAQLSVCMVAMTTKPIIRNCTFINVTVDGSGDSNSSYMKELCTNEFLPMENDVSSIYRSYSWNKATQEIIMWAFFAGYTSMMIPAGFLAQKFGGKLPILVALFVNGIVCILTPWLPYYGDWIAMSACRLVQGMAQSVFFPSIHTMLAKWAPLSERGRLSTCVYSGTQFGVIFAFQISGFLSGSPSLGWPSTFWFFGTLSLVCFCMLLWLGAASPHEHPSITPEELKFIIGSNDADAVPRIRKTPLKKILTSSAVWGLVAAHAGSAVGFLFILTQTPLYFSKVLGVEIKKNGLFSSLPYIAMYFMTIFFGWASDFCKTRNLLSIANIRKVATTIGLFLHSLMLIGFGYVQNTTIAVVLLIVCQSLHSGIFAGFNINQIDIAPNFAGSIMALSNMVANLAALSVPFVVSHIIKDDTGNQARWQTMFLLVAAVMIVTNLIFVLFARGDVQHWNYDEEDDVIKESMILENEKEKIKSNNEKC